MDLLLSSFLLSWLRNLQLILRFYQLGRGWWYLQEAVLNTPSYSISKIWELFDHIKAIPQICWFSFKLRAEIFKILRVVCCLELLFKKILNIVSSWGILAKFINRLDPSAVDLKLNFFLPNLARRAPLLLTALEKKLIGRIIEGAFWSKTQDSLTLATSFEKTNHLKAYSR